MELNPDVESYVNNMVNNLNKIVEIQNYNNNFIPTKRYLKLLLLLTAYNNINFDDAQGILIKLGYIDKRLAKFSSVYEDSLLSAFNNNTDLINEYRKYAEICVRTHNLDKVTSTIAMLPESIVNCPFNN